MTLGVCLTTQNPFRRADTVARSDRRLRTRVTRGEAGVCRGGGRRVGEGSPSSEWRSEFGLSSGPGHLFANMNGERSRYVSWGVTIDLYPTSPS